MSNKFSLAAAESTSVNRVLLTTDLQEARFGPKSSRRYPSSESMVLKPKNASTLPFVGADVRDYTQKAIAWRTRTNTACMLSPVLVGHAARPPGPTVFTLPQWTVAFGSVSSMGRDPVHLLGFPGTRVFHVLGAQTGLLVG